MNLYLTGNDGYNYLNESIYADYLADKIYNEQRLAQIINKNLIMNESSSTVAQKVNKITLLYESKLMDSIKAKWTKFVEFIKSLFTKFMTNLSKLILNDKAYCERYRDIILNKPPKSNSEFSYTGDYKVAMHRMESVKIPLFDYKMATEASNNIELAQKIINNTEVRLTTDSLPGQMKNFFIAADKGEQKGTISNFKREDMRMMYECCTDSKKIKQLNDSDLQHLNTSTNTIQNIINNNLTESFVFTEAEDEKPNGKSGLQITKAYNDEDYNNDTVTKAGQDQADAAKEDNQNTDSIQKAVTDWCTVCRDIIGARLTAYEQMERDFMKIIKVHVESYVGKTKNPNENDKANKPEEKEANK